MESTKTPGHAKTVGGLTTAQTFSSADVAHIFSVPGYSDDITGLPGLTVLTIKLITPKAGNDRDETAKEKQKGGRPKKWHFALPIPAF